MLSEDNYRALLRFRDGLVKYDTKLTEREELLRQAGFIRLVQRRETTHGTGYSMTYDQAYWKITALGEDALAEFEPYNSRKTAEKGSTQDNKEEKNILQKTFHFLQIPIKRAWALFVGFSAIVTVFGWPWISKAVAFLRSLF